MADLLCSGIVTWGKMSGSYTGHPGLDPWIERILARPARTPRP
jgi:glutathione S-transferase